MRMADTDSLTLAKGRTNNLEAESPRFICFDISQRKHFQSLFLYDLKT